MVQFQLISILVMDLIREEHLWWLKLFQYPFGSRRTNTGGKISSSSGVCDRWETATGVITFSLFSEDFSYDNMGNKEFSVGVFCSKKETI